MGLNNGTAVSKKPKARTVSMFNQKVMSKLQRALEADPNVDLSAVLSDSYVSRRNSIKLEEEQYQQHLATEPTAREVSPAISSVQYNPEVEVKAPPAALPQGATKVVFELSTTAMTSLRFDQGKPQDGELLTEAFSSMLRRGELLCSPATSAYLFKCEEGLVVKCFEPDQAANGRDFIEYTSMQYLERHIPVIPAPRPYGLLTSGRMAYMWGTYILGVTLEAAWLLLNSEQKPKLRDDLGRILDRMRGHEHSYTTLGGVQGKGCKDTRRGTRTSNKSIASVSTFYDFVYESPTGPKPTYVQVIQSWIPQYICERSVFTHGDLRPANIHVIDDNGQWRVTGLLDWEMSGFYLTWWEACKITNCMTPIEDWDWYLYLPACVSPSTVPYQCLNDHFWDRHLVGESGLIDIK